LPAPDFGHARRKSAGAVDRIEGLAELLGELQDTVRLGGPGEGKLVRRGWRELGAVVGEVAGEAARRGAG